MDWSCLIRSGPWDYVPVGVGDFLSGGATVVDSDRRPGRVHRRFEWGDDGVDGVHEVTCDRSG